MKGAILALMLFASCASSSLGERDPLAGSRQLVVVTTANWDATAGVLRRYGRERDSATWSVVGGEVPVAIGRTGLAWGRGLVEPPAPGPVKREGDGKAPAGIFALESAFGFDVVTATAMPYRQLLATTECVDDINSVHYNGIVESGATRDWSSSEQMRKVAEYRVGLVVDHNQTPVKSGGSCIFLHVWSAPDGTTAGCTAMAEADLRALLAWLRPAESPRLVQLPSAEYARLKSAWGLP